MELSIGSHQDNANKDVASLVTYKNYNGRVVAMLNAFEDMEKQNLSLTASGIVKCNVVYGYHGIVFSKEQTIGMCNNLGESQAIP